MADHRIDTAAFAAAAATASSRAEARRLLAAMQAALAATTYVGTAVHERHLSPAPERHVEVLRIAQRVSGREQRERIEFLTGEPRELVRSTVGERSEALCIFADRGLVLDGASARAAAPRMPVPEGALDRYRISSGPGGRQAGRHTEKVTLTPRDGDRYGHRLWVDTASRLPLRTETFRLLNERGDDEVLERFYYTDFELPAALADSELEPQLLDASVVERRRLQLLQVSQRSALLDTTRLTPIETPAAAAEPAAELSDLRWRAWLPPGFLPMRGGQPAKGQGHRVYSDGLASVSVFVEPGTGGARQGAPAPLERSQLGVLNAVSLRGQHLHVTVVGDVPAATVERIARSVRRR